MSANQASTAPSMENLPPIGVDQASIDAANQAHAQDVAARITEMAPSAPQVDLQPTGPQQRGSTSLDTYTALHDGQEVGTVRILTDRLGRNQSFQGINVDAEHQGKGFAWGIYRAGITKALEQGHAFKTHEYSQTPGTRRIWEKLGSLGVAQVVEPFRESDAQGRTMGLSVIKPVAGQFRHERNKPLWWDNK